MLALLCGASLAVAALALPAQEAATSEPPMADDPSVEPPAAAPAPESVEAAPEPVAEQEVIQPALGSVSRAQFTSAVVEREPTDALDVAGTDLNRVYFFTELMDMEGQTVTHRWSHEGELAAEVSFEVGGPRWRVYSSKNLMPDWTGTWTVDVVDAAGTVLYSASLEYDAAP
jgi:hypothetical protein